MGYIVVQVKPINPIVNFEDIRDLQLDSTFFIDPIHLIKAQPL